MKTAVSIPDDVFEAAEKAAKRLGVSRSELYANAVREFVERHRRDNITEKLNELYATEDAGLDPVLEELQRSSLAKEDW
jgi:metal-responsive CopG/Arc/MetJ family transcriptional regulator